MFIKNKLKPEQRAGYMTVLGGVAQMALAVAFTLGRISDPPPIINFISGVLIGFSLVGNLAFLIFVSRKWRAK